tara:strand:- start:157 stop:819 length:663 start_codon:yes stop_codon:yes gene_type:complete
MSRVRADRLTNRAGTGAPTFPNGAVITGVATATSFDGNATGLTGTPNIVVGSVTGTTGTFSGNVSVGGTLTYEDVTNVDSVGIITARAGVDLNGTLREKVNVTAGKLSDNLNIDLANGMVHLFTTAESTTAVPNIRVDGSTSLNSVMAIGESVVVTLITTANASAYSAQMTIDGGAQTENWVGGSAPSDGGSSGVDIHSFTIIKTASATFTVIANHSKTS